jgi:rubredoxin-NAD+ reductase
VLILGAGLIGCEFANDMSLGGYQVRRGGAVRASDADPAAPGRCGRAGGLEGLGVRFHLGPVLTRLQQVPQAWKRTCPTAA